jgi:hypothetical protein
VLHHLDDSIGLLSDPIGDPLTVPNALLFRQAASVGVVLDGEGGDSCFGGPKYLPMLLTALYPGGSSPEASYLRAHLKCYDDLPALLGNSVRDAFVCRPLEAEVAPLLSAFCPFAVVRPVDRGPLLSAARERLLDGLTTYGLFQRNYLEQLLAGKLGGLRPRHVAKIWLLVTLEVWLREVLFDTTTKNALARGSAGSR